MRFQLTAVGLACVTLLSACGGGSDKNSGGLAQSIAFPFLGGKNVAPADQNRATVPLIATASSGGAVTFVSNTPDVCSVEGLTLSLLKAAECSVTAKQAGGNGYVAAEQRQLFVIPKNDQTVKNFVNPGHQSVGASTELSATSDAGILAEYPIVFTGSTPAVCSVTGTTVATLADGVCKVTATQPGTDYYKPTTKTIQFAVGTAELPPLNFVSGYQPTGTLKTKDEGASDPKQGAKIETYAQFSAGDTVAADGSTFTYAMVKESAAPNFGGYYGIRFYAPGLNTLLQGANETKGVQIDGQGALKFNLMMNPEMVATNSTKLRVWLYLGHYHKKANGDNCNVTVERVMTPDLAAGVLKEQSVDLKSFNVVDSCELVGLDAWSELQNYTIGKIEFNVPDTNDQVPNPGTTTYTTSVTMGQISFR